MEVVSPQATELSPMSVVTSANEEYVVEKEVGQGGFGNVYHVRCQSGDFALKLTKMWKFTPNERVEYAKRFRQEYEYARLIPGENIVKPYDYDIYQGNPFIVMDYCPNGSLRTRMGQKWDARKLNQLAKGILKGLRNMHREGIIHRDLKPENVLFDVHGTPKLADFGISASIRSRMTRRNIMGQVKEVFASGVYSPPEQLDYTRAFKVMGNTNDIYAFGAVMYETITGGGLPFGSFEDFQADINAYEAKKKKGEWNKELLTASAPEQVWNIIIDKCLQFNPDNRYQQVEDILALLPTDNDSAAITNEVDSTTETFLLRIMNGDEIGRVYNLNNLVGYNQPDWKLQYNVFANWLNDNLKSDVWWNKNNIKVLTVGWFNKEEPFANGIGIAEHFTNYISRHHATLLYHTEAKKWFILDGQPVQMYDGCLKLPVQRNCSTNGTFVNSGPLQKALKQLQYSDIITIGDTTLKVMS